MHDTAAGPVTVGSRYTTRNKIGILQQRYNLNTSVQCESKIPPAACGFLTFFDKQLRILNQFFHTLIIRFYLR